jgi:hypothetical protein
VATPEERSDMNTAEFEPRFRLRTPIRGRTGAEIVGYHWVSHLEEGMFKDRRVSSWEDAQTSVPTGRKIVHLFWVRMPDTGEIILMGVGAAKKALGLTEAKLYSIAKAETAAQRYWKDIWDRQANKPYYGSAIEAKRAWIIANSRSPYFGSDIEKQRSFDEARARAVLMHRDGQWLLTLDQERVYELGLRGWEIVGPTAAPQVESNPHDTLTIYHTSARLIERIEKSYGVFNDVLFFSEAPYSMSGFGKYVYSIEIDPDKILDVTRLFYLHEGNEPPIVETIQRMMRVFHVSEEKAQRLLTDQDNVFDRIYDDDDDEGHHSIEGDLGEASWWIQSLQAELARDLGYDAAEMQDEHGTSYAIPMFGREKDLKLEKIESNPPDDRERYSEPYSLLEPGHAEQIALELQEEDPDWSYRVQHDPKGTGLSFIEIFDEDGEFVGRWNHA